MKVDGRVIDVSKPGKLLFPAARVTKRGLVDYYRRIAPTMLAHLEDRPLTVHRFPDGIEAGGFFQQNAAEYFPDWIARARLPKAEGGEVEHFLCNDTASLVYLADQAAITPHAWLARADRPDCPDRMILDLDPPDDDFALVRFAARSLRTALEELDLAAFVMTTGARGLHVVVPLDRSADFDASRAFARRLAEVVAARAPERMTTEQRKNKRRGRLFLDTLRNAYGQTAVAPYAVRARAGAPVAAPLDWSELGDAKLEAGRYHVGNIFRRLARKEDPWRNIARHAAALDVHAAALRRMERHACV